MMFMLPMLCAMAFPGCLPDVLIVFVPLGIMLGPVRRLAMWLLVFRLVVVCTHRFVSALVGLVFPTIRLVFVHGLCWRAPVLIFVFAIFMLLGIALPSVVVSVL
jgi:hypothetical protein